MKTYVYFDNNPIEQLDKVVAELDPSSSFLLVDSNTAYFVLPKLQQSKAVKKAKVITIKAGEINKDIEQLTAIWKGLVQGGANRRSLLICVGGGVVTDLGGMAAATFNRGIKYVNIPTSLLGAVDASVGGKTAINFAGIKNPVGCFYAPAAVIVSASLLETLNIEEILSGYAEMLKHALLSTDNSIQKLLALDVEKCTDEELLILMQESMRVKQKIVDQDPYEQGIRKALNFGHTIGHAFESLAIKRKNPIPHGYAVAYGMVAELVLSNIKHAFPSELMHTIAAYIKNKYGAFPITCNSYDRLYELMHHDKKNTGDEINFALLSEPGKMIVDNPVSTDEIGAALDIYRDLML